jgi:hypothetical protein
MFREANKTSKVEKAPIVLQSKSRAMRKSNKKSFNLKR